MTDRMIEVRQIFDLGIIKLVDQNTTFPWEFFANGDINCLFQTADPKNMNNIRIWINEHIDEIVYIEQTRYGNRRCTIGFTDPKDAVKFLIKFGDEVKKFDG